MIASGDPLNLILASVWTGVLLFCLWLTWYAYARWKRNPGDSLSHRIAARVQQAKVPSLIGIGIVIGLVVGMFAGHWFWPVQLGATR
jgi:hypothetical protein